MVWFVSFDRTGVGKEWVVRNIRFHVWELRIDSCYNYWNLARIDVSLLFEDSLQGHPGQQPQIPTAFKFEPQLQNVREERGNYVVPISITNMGSAALEAIKCSVWLEPARGERPDKKQVDITMLGHGECTDVEVWFDR